MTIEGQTRRLERPFLVLATQNPIEHEGTYPLPEAQLDRFLLRISVGYPSREDELGVLEQRRDRRDGRGRARPRSSTARRCARCSRRSRTSTSRRASATTSSTSSGRRATAASVQVGASPRGTLAILKLARAPAALDGRDFVVPDDVKAVAGPALAHRLSLRPELWVQQRARRRTSSQERLETVPTPPAEDDGEPGRPLAEARRLRRARRPRADRRARHAPARARRARRALPARPRGRARSSPPIPSSGSVHARARPPARGRRARRSRSTSSAERTVERAGGAARRAARPRLVDGDNPAAVSRRRARATLALRIAGRALGRVFRSATSTSARAIRSACSRVPASSAVRHRPQGLPAPGGAARPAAPGRDPALLSGDELSRRKGEGIEFADLRPFTFGDRVRRINWRASARRGELWVNEQHPERNVDVVLFLDSFAEARRGAHGHARPRRARGRDADRAVHPAARPGRPRLLRRHSALAPPRRRARRSSTASSTRCSTRRSLLSYAWKAIDIVPARTLPPQALVIALTPLLDERSVGALLDLRARGFDLAGRSSCRRCRSSTRAASESREQLAYRLWKLQRDALRAEFLAAGVPVAEWRDGEPLAAPIEEVTAFRRHAKLARA